MPFEKGRQKTGGRQKGGPVRKATKFVDQLNAHHFNYPKELAEILLELKKTYETKPKDAAEAKALTEKVMELKFYYNELKSLLPYMAPKLREKEVDTSDEPETPGDSKAPISDEDLLKALGNGPTTPDLPRTRDQAPLGAGNPKPQVPHSAKENLPDLAGEQEEDA